MSRPQDWTPDAEADVIKLTGRVGVTHDSNVLRLNNQSQGGIYANKKAGDTYLNGGMGIEFDRLISQQRLRANAEVEGFKYKEYNDFDHVGYNAGATLDWVVGRPLFRQRRCQAGPYPAHRAGPCLPAGHQRQR